MDVPVPGREAARLDALSELGQRLSAAQTAEEAARIIMDIALRVLGWDAFSLDRFSEESGRIYPILTMDTLDDRRVEVPPAYKDIAPSPMARRILYEGALRVDRPEAGRFSSDRERASPVPDSSSAPSPAALRGPVPDPSPDPMPDSIPEMVAFGDVSRPSASLLFVPIRSASRVIGILSIQSYTPHAYSDEDLRTLQVLADHCGGALERIYAEQKFRESKEEERLFLAQLQALHQVSNALSRATDWDTLCRQAVEMGRSALGFDRLGIWFLTEEPGIAAGSFGVDENGQIRDERNARVSTHFAADMEVMLSRRAPYLFDAQKTLYNQCIEPVGQGSRAMAPLWDGEMAIGYISTDNLLGAKPITRRACELLALYAATLGHLCSRLRVEEARRQDERRFRNLLENSVDAIALLARDGTILYGSPATTRILGYPLDDFVGRNAFDLLYPEDQSSFAHKIAEVVERPGVAVTIQARVLHRDGSWRLLEGVFSNQLDDPSVRAIVTNYRDISERKILEEQLQHAQKMEGIGRLAGGIAHDFNNLLTAILGYCELSELELRPGDPVRSHLQQIQGAAARAAGLTDQLLAFARKQLIAPKTIDLNEVALNLSQLLRRLIGEDIELVMHCEPELGLVKADAGQIEQVLINLAVNARDAMAQGGTLTIETANTVLDTAYSEQHPHVLPGDYVCLTVGDTGMGMDAAIQSRVFEPFFTTKEVGKGTGLGLATCHGIIKQHGGHIELLSNPGQGTTFRIYLPRVKQAHASAAHRPDSSLPRGRETILLVEDEGMVRTYAAQILRRQGYTVLEAEDGGRALMLAQEYPKRIDLLLTDVVMPQMSGRILAERLQESRSEIKVLYVSGYTDDTVVQHGISEAGVAFLPKPYTSAALAQKVRETLEKPDRQS